MHFPILERITTGAGQGGVVIPWKHVHLGDPRAILIWNYSSGILWTQRGMLTGILQMGPIPGIDGGLSRYIGQEAGCLGPRSAPSAAT